MPVSRQKLYEEVWAEPMVKVAARYEVSSSFLARICARLNVPRPSRGYWAQQEVGKADEKPPLPAPRPGDEIEWNREGPAKRLPHELPRAPVGRSRSIYPRGEQPERHELLADARKLFEVGKVLETGYLRPAKRRLVDIFVAKDTLERALDVANSLFLALESRGHRVTLDHDQYLSRPDLEVRSDGGQSLYSHRQWRPDRPTLVFVGTVAIGLTVFEFSDEVAVRFVDGEWVRVPETLQGRGQRGAPAADPWASTREMPSGKLGIRASSPYMRTAWARQWSEADGSDLSKKAEHIAREIEAAAPKIAALAAEAERQREVERKEQEAAFAKWEREDAERQHLQNTKKSREDLLAVIDAWDAVRRIEGFFEDAERRATALPEQQAEDVRNRVRRARALIGETDALGRLLAWQAPDER